MADSSNPYAQFAPQPAAATSVPAENPYTQFAPEAPKENAFIREAKNLGSAAVRGVAGLPAMIGDAIFDMGSMAANVPEELIQKHKPDMSKNVQSVDVKNKTSGEKWRSSIAEGVAGAVSTGPGAIVRNTITGAGAGAGAEAGERIAPGNPLARLAGGVAGGVTGGTAANIGKAVLPNAGNLANQAMEGITPQQLERAAQVQALARQQGVDLDLAQALETVTGRGSNLTAIRDTMANSRHGDRVQNTLRGQPNQLETAADATVGRLPGPTWEKQQAVNNVQEAATQRITNEKSARTAAVQPDYAAVRNLQDATPAAMIATIEKQLGQPGTTQATREAGLASIAQIKERTSNLTLPLHGNDADELVRSMRGQFKGSPLIKPDAKSDYQVGKTADDVDSLILGDSAELKRAREHYAQISRDKVDPLKQGPVGQVATPRGYLDDKAAPAARLESMFARGSDPAIPAAQRDLNAFAAEIKKVDPDVFPGAAKAFLRNRINKAVAGDAGQAAGQGDPATAKKLYTALFESRAQMQGMRDTAAGIARAYNLPEADVVRGLETFATITKAAANRPGRVAGMNPAEIAQQAGQNPVSSAARVFGFIPFERVARAAEDAVQGATFRTFDDLLTSPEGAQTLARLGRTPVMSGKAQTILGTFFGLPATVPTDNE